MLNVQKALDTADVSIRQMIEELACCDDSDGLRKELIYSVDHLNEVRRVVVNAGEKIRSCRTDY